VVVDVTRIEYREDIRVLQLCRDLDFMQEFLIPGVSVALRQLQRNALLLDRIVGTVDIGKRAGRDPADNPVFPDLLSSS